MTVLRDLSMLWSLFHILILFMLLYRSRFSRIKTILYTCIAMGPIILLNMTGLILFGAGIMGKVFILTCTLPSLLFFWIVSKDKKGRFFFTFCLADTVALWIIAVTNIADFYFGGQQYILMFAGRFVLFPLTEWAAVRYLRKPYLELQDSVPGGWGIFAGMTALYYLLLAVFANFPTVITARPQELPAFVVVLVLMPMTYATIFAALYRQLLLYRKQRSERVLQEQKNTLAAQLENQRMIRKLRHDMKGHAVTLSGLLSADRTQEALEYLKKLVADMDVLWGQFCANPYLNAVFSHYSQRFQEMDARLKLDIRVGEEELPYMELCQILSNGLDNARTALEELPPEDREASVQMKYSRDYLVLRIRNRCREGVHVEKGTVPSTSKTGAGHGYGLATIREDAGRLGGDMLCYTENGYFVLDVMLWADRP